MTHRSAMLLWEWHTGRSTRTQRFDGVSRQDAFPFHPLLVRTLKFATNDDGSDHGLAIGSAMDHPPRVPPRSASWDALPVRPNGFL